MEGFVAIIALFIALPWIILHYVTQWKKTGTLTAEDENLLDELHETARKLDERLCTIERIMSAENPNWRSVACDPSGLGIEDQSSAVAPGLGRTSRSNQPSGRI